MGRRESNYMYSREQSFEWFGRIFAGVMEKAAGCAGRAVENFRASINPITEISALAPLPDS